MQSSQGGTIKWLVSALNIARAEKSASKMISADVNEKTIDHVMAGVEAVTGRRSTHQWLESFRRFDRNYLKKWLISEDAEDLLALRMQKITLDEHYARLYGPAVMIHQQQAAENEEHRQVRSIRILGEFDFLTDQGRKNEKEEKIDQKN